jgi:hypothetical protein
MRKRLLSVFLQWIPLAFVACVAIGFAGVAVQQNYRQSLNDPQVQMVAEAQAALEAGTQPTDLVPRTAPFDAATSLAPFLVVYDASGAILASSATVHGQPPHMPQGVLTDARDDGENRVTWEPEEGTRIAMVVRPADASGATYFVGAGRNMRVVESREDALTTTMFLALLVALLGSFILMYGGGRVVYYFYDHRTTSSGTGSRGNL